MEVSRFLPMPILLRQIVSKGAIFNLDKTTQVLVSVIQKLEEDLQASIKKVYVGIGGQSIRSTRNNVTKQLGKIPKYHKH